MSVPHDPAEPRDLIDSDQDTAGGMGVSSERVGPTGPGQVGTTGTRDVGPADDVEHDDVPPEQRPGGEEPNSESPPPKSGYSATDPRSD